MTPIYNLDLFMLFNLTDNLGIQSCWVVIMKLTDIKTFDEQIIRGMSYFVNCCKLEEQLYCLGAYYQ